MKEKSYTELMKLAAMNRNKMQENFIQDLYIDMLLTEIQLNVEKEKLMRTIDSCLERGDEKTFRHLSGQLKEVNKRLGT